jgi:hypothetical protein
MGNDRVISGALAWLPLHWFETQPDVFPFADQPDSEITPVVRCLRNKFLYVTDETLNPEVDAQQSCESVERLDFAHVIPAERHGCIREDFENIARFFLTDRHLRPPYFRRAKIEKR